MSPLCKHNSKEILYEAGPIDDLKSGLKTQQIQGISLLTAIHV